MRAARGRTRRQARSFIVRSVWAACLMVAGANHVGILLQHGLFWDYGGVGWPSALYWTSLTILDPLVAALLFTRPRAGIVGTIALIGTNVVHNVAITAKRAPDGEFLVHATSNPFLAAQIAFLLFVVSTARIAWIGTARVEAGTEGRSGARRRAPDEGDETHG